MVFNTALIFPQTDKKKFLKHYSLNCIFHYFSMTDDVLEIITILSFLEFLQTSHDWLRVPAVCSSFPLKRQRIYIYQCFKIQY